MTKAVTKATPVLRKWGAIGDSITLGFGATDWNGSYAVLAGIPRIGRPGQELVTDNDWYPAFIKTFDQSLSDMKAQGISVILTEIGINQFPVLWPWGDPVTDANYRFAYMILDSIAKRWSMSVVSSAITPWSATRTGVTPEMRAQRIRINTWLRQKKYCVDLAAPLGGDTMLPQYDSGDGLHPNDAGHHAMAARLVTYMKYHRFTW